MKTTKTQKYTKSDFERFMMTGQAPAGIHNGSIKVTKHDSDTEYKLERGVPIPEYSRTWQFPLLNMEIGDSFVIPLSKLKSLRNSITRMHRKNDSLRFITRTVHGRGRAGKQTRVWRVTAQ